MTASRVLAAVLAVCVAQNVVYGATLYDDKPLQDINKDNAVGSNNYFGCMAAMVPLYKVIDEFRTLYKDFNKIKGTFRLLRDQCEKMTDPAAKENCLKDADELLDKEADKFLPRVQTFFSNTYTAIRKLKECFITE